MRRPLLGAPTGRRRIPLSLIVIVLLAIYAPRLIDFSRAATPPAATESAGEGVTAEDLVSMVEEGGDEGGHGGEVSRVLLALVVIMLAAKMGGELLERVGQPAVLGELALGVIIGNLGLVGYHGFEYLKHDMVLEILAEIGVILLLFEVGLESNIHEMASVGLSSLLVALLGVVAPFFLGWGVAALFWPQLVELMPPEARAAVGPYAMYVHIFIGAVLCATSVGITARVLRDMGRIRSRESRIILGAAVIDDVLGLIILAVCVGVVSAVGGGKPLELGNVQKRLLVEEAPMDVKREAFAAHAVHLIEDRDLSAYLYDAQSGSGRFVGEVRPEFREAIEGNLPTIEAGGGLPADEIQSIGRAENFDELGYRVFVARTEFTSFDVLWIVLISVAFFVGMILAGLILVAPIYRFATYLRVHGVLLTSSLMICFVSAFIASKIGLAPIVGAFAAGLILEDVHFKDLDDRKSHTLEELLMPLTTFLTPIFFVRMGITVDLSSFANVSILGFALALTAVAILGKQACSLGVVEKGLDRFAVGLGMIPRGEVGLIFAAEGTKLMIAGQPVIDPNLLSAVVIMVMVTTMVTPPVLKWKFGDSKAESGETS